MNKQNIQALLPFVEMPSRYLGSEVNSVKKKLTAMDLTVVLAFPDLYEIGTSHFGLQILYTILNKEPAIAAERVYTPAPDMEELLRKNSVSLKSLESKQDLKAFDIIGFSLLYELNFTNILTMLDLSGIPSFAKDRDESYPLIIGGGPCAFNPEPLADFFDAIVVGDGEEAILEVSKAVVQWKKSGDGKKNNILKLLREIQGVYIPSFFKASYDENGIQHLEPESGQTPVIRRAILPRLDKNRFPTSPIVPFGKPVHDRLRLEIARGCSRGCRFCQAGMIYRPVREQSPDDLVSIAKEALGETGYSDVSLLSLSTGDYSNLEQLMSSLMAVNTRHCTAISLPSVRAGRLTPELMRIIKSVRKTGFTIAPEAGSQRLRDVINKNITEEDITDTVTNAFELGWRTIKLYFMNGLPTETQADIEAVCDLAKRLAGIRVKGKGRSKINVSFAPFIPKPHTPFQRVSQIAVETASANLNYLKQNLRHPGINLKWHNPEMSLLEGVWARGDRKLSSLLVSAWEKGCRLDGWTDHFRWELWQEAFDENGIDPAFYTTRKRKEDEPLPWDHIDSGISGGYFKDELKRALKAETTPDCREESCTGCGVCDFKAIEPVVHKRPGDAVSLNATFPAATDSGEETNFIKLRFFYSRLSMAKHFGHLELAKIIRRAVRRIGVKVKYSKGFHPAMKLSFDNPLPVGMESQEEFFNLFVDIKVSPDAIVGKMNTVLPEGITITRCVPVASLKKGQVKTATAYRIILKNSGIEPGVVERVMELDHHWVEQTSFKGKTRKTDLRKVIQTMELLDSTHLMMVLVEFQGRTIRPAEILTRLLKVPRDAVQQAEILKLKQD